MPTWMDFGLKNPPKAALGRLLGRLVAVLGRLGGLLRRLEETSKNDAKKECTKSRQKMRLQASLANLEGGGQGRARARYGGGFRSGPLNYHLPK